MQHKLVYSRLQKNYLYKIWAHNKATKWNIKRNFSIYDRKHYWVIILIKWLTYIYKCSIFILVIFLQATIFLQLWSTWCEIILLQPPAADNNYYHYLLYKINIVHVTVQNHHSFWPQCYEPINPYNISSYLLLPQHIPCPYFC